MSSRRLVAEKRERIICHAKKLRNSILVLFLWNVFYVTHIELGAAETTKNCFCHILFGNK